MKWIGRIVGALVGIAINVAAALLLGPVLGLEALPWVCTSVAFYVLWNSYLALKSPPRPRPDYQKIHALEHELGFRDDPPPGTPEWFSDAIRTKKYGKVVVLEEGVSYKQVSGAMGVWQIPPQQHRRVSLREYHATLQTVQALSNIIKGDIEGRIPGPPD